MSRKKLATYWLGGCSGCHISLLDIDERLLEVARLADIVKCPLVDAKGIPEADIALIEGAATSDRHLEELREIRRRSKTLVALGDCAVTGNVTSLRNPFPWAAVLARSYKEAESNEGGKPPEGPEVSALLDRAVPLHQVVKVDHYIPGCPPSADLIHRVLVDLLNSRVPEIPEPKFG
jgi:NAD-reducing hydrogenase small subunit